MMKSQHTPGPWHWLGNKLKPSERIYLSSPTEYVDWHIGDPESDANAALIAAAPELLEACEGLLRETDGQKLDIKKDYSLILFREAAKKAIAKAKGIL